MLRGLVVDCAHRHLPTFQHLQIGIGEIVVVVAEIALRGQTVGVGTHLYVQTVESGLLRVVGAAPVGDHDSVESPFIAQDVLEQTLVVAGVLTLIAVVGAHYAPHLAILHGLLEGRKIYLIERTVADFDVNSAAPFLPDC